MFSKYKKNIEYNACVSLHVPLYCSLVVFAAFLLTACGGDTSGTISGTTTNASSPNTPEHVTEILPGDTGSHTNTNTNTNTNSPPVVSPISIGPVIPTAATALQALHDRVFDTDGDRVWLTYTWTINDTIQIQTDRPRLAPGIVSRGDRVQVELQVSDYLQTTTVVSPVVVIKNAPPSGSIRILPLNAKTSDELSLSVFNINDADGDSVDLSYQWFLNGVRLQNQSAATLPAGIAKFPDIVSARVSFSDGSNSNSGASFDLALTDTPSVLDRQNIPSTLPYGVAATFPIRYEDPDGMQIITSLVEAPEGMSYDSATGLVNWTPTPFMFNNTETFQAQLTSSDGQTGSIEITVVDDNGPPLLARSGIEVPVENTAFDIGDFDSDGRVEILSTDSVQRILTLEFDGAEFKQDWLYPFGLIDSSKIIAIWSHGSDGSQIIAATDTGVNLISSRTKPPRQVYNAPAKILASALADINQDGLKELALLTNQETLVVLRTDNWQPFLPEISLPGQHHDYFYGVAIGNVDTDPALEIVVSSGEVIDGTSGAIQWQYTERFGSIIAIGDVDGDGDNEILSADPRGDLTTHDALTQTLTRQYDQTDTCSLGIYNADDDPQAEVFHAPCVSRPVQIFDTSDGTLALQEQFIDSIFNTSGKLSISIGDVDSDGISEVVFATGAYSSGANSIVVASVAGLGDIPSETLNDDPAQIGSFHIAGWTTNAAGEDVAVFSIPSTLILNGAFNGHRVGLLSEAGEFAISNVTVRSRGSSKAGAVIDSSANNGVDGVLVAVEDMYQGPLMQINLGDFSIQYSHQEVGGEPPFRPNIVSIAVDYVEDGSAVAVLATSHEQLQIFDITDRQSTWTSEALSGQMIGAITIDSDFNNADSDFSIVAATRDELTLWTESASGNFTKAYTATAECSYLVELKLEGETNIACVDVGFRNERTLQIFSSQLIKLSEVSLDYETTALAATESGRLLIAEKVESDTNYATHQSRIHLVNPTTGYSEWSSETLVGVATGISVLSNASGEVEKLGVSTTRAMYIGSR